MTTAPSGLHSRRQDWTNDVNALAYLATMTLLGDAYCYQQRALLSTTYGHAAMSAPNTTSTSGGVIS